MNSEGLENRLNVKMHRFRANLELFADLFVGQSLEQLLQNAILGLGNRLWSFRKRHLLGIFTFPRVRIIV